MGVRPPPPPIKVCVIPVAAAASTVDLMVVGCRLDNSNVISDGVDLDILSPSENA